MKIFRTQQIKEIDNFTIRNEPVASVDLMERAADQLLRWYMRNFDRSERVVIFYGPGNNGGDGLALARLLSVNRFKTEVYFVNVSEKTSEDWNRNYQRLEKETSVISRTIENIDQFPFISSEDIIIDAIFGSGLTRPAEGLAGQVINRINQAKVTVISVDIPSGLFCEDNTSNNPDTIIQADFTLSFEFPKLCFMFLENARFVGEWFVLPISLNKNVIINTKTSYFFIDDKYVHSLLKQRKKFDHKGKYGHGLLVAGSFGKMGAAILGAKAALRTGIGLITCHVPGCGYDIIQTSVPEAMARVDINNDYISETGEADTYDALGIGPGIGTSAATQEVLNAFLYNRGKPLIIDADGINILGMNKQWLSELPAGTLLTPHVREFERIAGSTENSYQRLERQMEFAEKYNCIVILKGACSSIATPLGEVFFNSTGNPGMATAGSGDVLTGMLLSLLSQGYSPESASVVGVFLHGLAGDLAASVSGYESIIASDIIDNIGNAFVKLRNYERV